MRNGSAESAINFWNLTSRTRVAGSPKGSPLPRVEQHSEGSTRRCCCLSPLLLGPKQVSVAAQMCGRVVSLSCTPCIFSCLLKFLLAVAVWGRVFAVQVSSRASRWSRKTRQVRCDLGKGWGICISVCACSPGSLNEVLCLVASLPWARRWARAAEQMSRGRAAHTAPCPALNSRREFKAGGKGRQNRE